MEETRKIKDGWHRIYEDIEVLVEDGIVVRGVYTPKGRTGWMEQKTVYPYRWSKKLHCWNSVNVSLSALRSGMSRGTIDLR